jgi:anti-anti-sigma factor
MLIITVETLAAEVSACDSRSAVLHLEGTLQTPVDIVLRSRVESLLRGGARQLVLDLSGVADIDASGVGELVHLCKTVAAVGGALEIGPTSPRVRRVLDVAGVLELLTEGAVR